MADDCGRQRKTIPNPDFAGRNKQKGSWEGFVQFTVFSTFRFSARTRYFLQKGYLIPMQEL